MSGEADQQGGMLGAISRVHWSSRIGFILAASGSAIGLGNIWKFPYITGVYGGGAFVLVYLASVLIVGLPLMFAELIIGRRAQENPVGAFQKLSREGSPWQLVGWMGILSGFLILSFYSVVAGWGVAYIFKAIQGFSGDPELIAGQFTDLVGNTSLSILWHTVFMALVIGIVAGGIKAGIERWSKILMPVLMLILGGLMVYGLGFTPGGARTLEFLFYPDFSKLTGEGILSALGHAFFTLSLGMGAMITYGSYMSKKARLVRDAVTISILDTAVALVAGIAIFSIVFSFDLEPAAGPGLIFQTLPALFTQTGKAISVPFFVLFTFAALTSAISLLEVVVSYFIDRKGWGRLKACLIVGLSIYVVGLLSAVSSLQVPFSGGMDYFTFFDELTTNYMLPLGGFFICIFIAYVVSDKVRREELQTKGGLWYSGLVFTLKIITPVAVLLVLLHGLKII